MSSPIEDDRAGFVSRGGVKLAHALDAFRLSVTGFWCADFGCSTGGFTDCLLKAGAARVFSLDTGYGVLAWSLRKDPRVTVLERTNALHASPPPDLAARAGADLVVMDVGWTPQRLAVPAALRWCAPAGRIISLVKPHYELTPVEKKDLLIAGVLQDADARRMAERTAAQFPALGVRLLGLEQSPVRGSGGKSAGAGNLEWLALLQPVP